MQRNKKKYNKRKTDIQMARDKQKRAQYKRDLRKNKWFLMHRAKALQKLKARESIQGHRQYLRYRDRAIARSKKYIRERPEIGYINRNLSTWRKILIQHLSYDWIDSIIALLCLIRRKFALEYNPPVKEPEPIIIPADDNDFRPNCN